MSGAKAPRIDDLLGQITYNDSRVLVTLDKDFGELAVRYDLPHSGILRLVATPVVEQAACARHA